MQAKVLAIVPAYNEEGNIGNVIKDIKASMPWCDIMVVNDCSGDGTAEAAGKTGDAMVVSLPCNTGVGGAVQTGFMHAFENNYDFAVQIDGDGQHIPSEVQKLFRVMEDTGCDVVIGSRFTEGNDTFRSTAARRVGIRLFSVLLKFITGREVTDATSGFRLYNRKSLSLLARHYPDDYPEPEAIVLLHNKGLIIRETGVLMRERQSGKSSITPFKSIYYMLKVVLCIFLAGIRKESS